MMQQNNNINKNNNNDETLIILNDVDQHSITMYSLFSHLFILDFHWYSQYAFIHNTSHQTKPQIVVRGEFNHTPQVCAVYAISFWTICG